MKEEKQKRKEEKERKERKDYQSRSAQVWPKAVRWAASPAPRDVGGRVWAPKLGDATTFDFSDSVWALCRSRARDNQ